MIVILMVFHFFIIFVTNVTLLSICILQVHGQWNTVAYTCSQKKGKNRIYCLFF